jgi:hypothetical protein
MPLREYSEGTFTPTFTFATAGNLSNAYTTQTGHWKRLGNIIFFSYRLNVTPTHTTASGAAQFGGLPFTVGTTISPPAPVRMIGATTWPASNTFLVGVPTIATTYLQIFGERTGVGETALGSGDFTSGAAVNVAFQGFYFLS